MNNCKRCGVATDPGDPQPNVCEKCPPVVCGDCHEPDDRYCSCWESFADMSFADVKAAFAEMGLSVGLPKADNS